MSLARPQTAPSPRQRLGAVRPRRLPVALAAALLLQAGAALAAGALPSGAQVAAGQASIHRAGNTLTIQQATPKLVTNWQDFSIGAGQTVQFVQPSASAVALNRVLGANVSTIQGALKANGQVFLLNPNGVMFSPGAQVDVGGIVASTLNLADGDFARGVYRFQGPSTQAVHNQGRITAADGGAVALIAAKLSNSGSLQADRGQVLLGAGNDVTLDLGAAVKLQIHQGALDAQIDNGGAVRADGGTVLLTAKAADALSTAVINQTGVVRARTLATGERGEIVLLADMAHGTLHAGGRLDATAPGGGHGGFIETSGAYVEMQPGLQVDAGARSGRGGTWLVDPFDYTIDATAAANIVGALNTGTSVTVTTQANTAAYGATASGSGDITVASAITKSAGGAATLTLQADRSVIVNAPITSTSGALGITLSAANNPSSNLGGVNVGANLTSNGGRILIGGAGGNTGAGTLYGIGYALNPTLSDPAVKIGTNVTISSGGGNITINGRSAATAAGSYTGVRGGVYVLSGATVDSGGGNTYVSGVSAADDKVFGFGLEASAGTTTTFRTATSSGALVVDARNSVNALGALGLTSNGSQARIQFWAPSVAHFLFRINGDNKATVFTQSPPCNAGYPNCGTMVIPGGNQSYTSAGYNVVSMAMLPIYVFTGSGTKEYDGNTDATGVALSSLGGPGGFSVGNLGTLSFSTASKHVGDYDILASSPSNPSGFSSGTYAVAYFNQGSYTITPKPLSSFQAVNKTYDGTTAANVTASGIVNGDTVTINATGGFTSANVDTGIPVSVTAVSLGGADAGNYSVPAFGTINTTANITPAPLTVTAANDSRTYDGNAYSGGNGVTYNGLVNGEQAASVLGGTLSYTGSSQGAVNVGSYVITPQGLTANHGNYSITFADGALTIDPAALTAITGSLTGSASRVYDGTANATLAPGNFLLSGFAGGEGATVTKTSGSYDDANVGSSKLVTVTLDASDFQATGSTNLANYSLPTTVSGNIGAITPAALSVTAAAASKTYDGQAFSGGNGVSYSGFVNNETAATALTGTLAYSGNSQGAVNAGSYAITPQGLSANHGNYAITFGNGMLTVNPAALSVTAAAASKTYDGQAFSGGNGVSYSGFVNNETAATALTGTLAYSGNSQGAVNVGSYVITPQGLTANHGNYAISFADGTLTIDPAGLTAITGSLTGSASRVYDGTTQATLAPGNFLLSGFAGGEGATVTKTSGSYDDANVGSSKLVTVTLDANDFQATGSTNLANYSLPTTVSGNIGAITPAALSVTAAAASKTYDGQAFSGGNGVGYSGFVNGETAATALTGTLAYTGNSQGAINAGSYTLTPGGLSANHGNYTISYGNGTLTVNPATLTLTAGAASRTYGAANPVFGGTVTGFVNGETAATALTGTPVFGSSATSSSNVGSHAITGSGLAAHHGNYVFVQAAGNAGALSITPAALSVTAADASKTYDGQAFSGGNGVGYSGFVNNETAATALTGTLSFSGNSQGAVNAGSYAITPGGLSANHGNYTIGYGNGALTVNPATLTLTADAASRPYGAANPALAGTVTGFVNGETAATALIGAPVFDSSANSSSNVGSYAITGSGLAAHHGNYVFVQAAGNAGALSITPAALSVTAADASKTYDGQAFSGGNGVGYSGFVNGETAAVLQGTLAWGGSAQGAVNAGSYTILPAGLTAANYTISYGSGTLAVNPATLTIRVSPASRLAGAANPGFDASVSGFVGGDTLGSATSGSLVFSTVAGLASLAGSYGVVADGLSALHGNYVFVQAPGNAQALAVQPVQASPERFLPRLEPVPNFPDNALPALGSRPVMPGFGNLNFVALGSSVSAQQAANLPAAVVSQLAPTGGTVSATGAGSGVPSTGTSVAAGTAGGIAQAGSASGSTTGSATAAGTGGGSDGATGSTSSGGASPAPSRNAKLGSANIAVPSANGPLDIYVISGGINTGEPQRRAP
jgi:filamentous hemagglutinin family protein